MLGKTYFMLGDSAKAAGELEIAMKLAPHDVDLAYTLGIAYLVSHKVDSARQLFDKMLTEFGDQPQLHVVIGRAYRESGLLPEAIAEFQKAIALDRSYPRAHYYLGLTYLLDEGQPKLGEALEEFKTELAANPDELPGSLLSRCWLPGAKEVGSRYHFLRKSSLNSAGQPRPLLPAGPGISGVG
jgi:tetratricopeptide (TPR) repeat protein